jgi:hypothetical protein
VTPVELDCIGIRPMGLAEVSPIGIGDLNVSADTYHIAVFNLKNMIILFLVSGILVIIRYNSIILTL